MVAQAVSPALPILDDFCHGLLGPELSVGQEAYDTGYQP